jgi:hypothetical protein
MPVFYGGACDSACNQVLAVPATRKPIPFVSGFVTVTTAMVARMHGNRYTP